MPSCLSYLRQSHFCYLLPSQFENPKSEILRNLKLFEHPHDTTSGKSHTQSHGTGQSQKAGMLKMLPKNGLCVEGVQEI
jgi:hypothetical protein